MPDVIESNSPVSLSRFFRRGDLIFIFMLAVILRLTLLAASNNQAGIQQVFDNSPDSIEYMNMARSIASGSDEHEFSFFVFGPGYAYYLALTNIVFGGRLGPTIVLNIIVSSLSCLLIYLFAMMLLRSYAVAIVAALLAALSYDSITLSCYLLSDTIYFAIFLSGLLLYLKALDSGAWKYFIFAGILTGLAILIRSIGQFWPVMMIIIAIASAYTPRKDFFTARFGRKRLFSKVAVTVAIVLAIVSIWLIRNYSVHGVPTLAFTSAGGPANIANQTIARLEKLPYEKVKGRVLQIEARWVEDYLNTTGQAEISLGDRFRVYSRESRQIIDSLKWEAVKTYLLLTWENVNEINYLHRHLLPKYKRWMIRAEYVIKDYRLNYLNFVLSMIGLGILLWQRRFKIAVVLGSVYFYYVAMVGFTRWQGSRLFLPAQIAWAVLIAVTLIWAYRMFGHLLEVIRDKATSRQQS